MSKSNLQRFTFNGGSHGGGSAVGVRRGPAATQRDYDVFEIPPDDLPLDAFDKALLDSIDEDEPDEHREQWNQQDSNSESPLC